MIAEVNDGDPDFELSEVRANLELAIREHPRLSEVITGSGLWTKVDVDLEHHLITIPGEDAKMYSGGIAEEPDNLRAALENMPAFQTEGRPLWQVVFTPRKIVLDFHHGLVDGVGLAVIAASIFQGKTLAEINKDMCGNLKPRESDSRGFIANFIVGLKAALIVLWYFATPVLGLFAPQPKSAVFAQGQPAKKRTRLVHLGPFDLEALKQASRQNSCTLNGALVHAVSQGLHTYCRGIHGESAALPTRMAVPVSFKKPCAGNPRKMHANNDFSTIAMTVPPPLGDGMQSASRIEKVPLAGCSSRGLTARVDASEALAARNAQAVLSFLPLPVIRWLYNTSSRLFSFCFSNVDASWTGLEFIAYGSLPSSQVIRRIRVYGYGAPPADISLFILANSHGPDLHVGIAAGIHIQDVDALSRALHSEISKISSNNP